MNDIRELLEDIAYGADCLSEQYDGCIIGTTTNGEVVYDYDKIIQYLMEHDNISEEDAIDFIEYNIVSLIPSSSHRYPVIVNSIE